MKREMICIVCPTGCRLTSDENGSVSGYFCERGLKYAISELTAPKRVVSSTVRLTGDSAYSRLPVKLDAPVDKELIKDIVKQLDKVTASPPIKIGEILIENVLNSGANFVAARSINK